ncbi:adenosine deaminase-like protein [Phlebotomus argentipes]|uniref:adenosine deaminase-like protein n=1 Tax=Phlebotomus argentipes TaxID=94469 RepID=UPI002892D45E|nr:adenosine deaminase-like protein [Phlebotomus argentipes]
MDCKSIPKIELHAHLNGSLSNANILELHQMKYPRNDQDVNSEAYKVEKELLDLTQCFVKFKYAHDLTDCPERLARATENVIRDFAVDNVVYLEIRTTPRATDFMSRETYLSTVCESIRKGVEKHPGILVKLIPSIDRSKGVAVAEETVLLAVKMKEKYPDLIVGIDLSGNPENTEFRDFQGVLEKARNSGLKLALHCAETTGTVAENLEMLQFGMDRIGHGTFMDESSETWKMLLDKKILVECCVSSNLKCGTVSHVENHHIGKLLEARHPVAICTDDFGVFNTSLSREIELCAKTFNLPRDAIEEITVNSIRHSFASANEKSRLQSLVHDFYRQQSCG